MRDRGVHVAKALAVWKEFCNFTEGWFRITSSKASSAGLVLPMNDFLNRLMSDRGEVSERKTCAIIEEKVIASSQGIHASHQTFYL